MAKLIDLLQNEIQIQTMKAAKETAKNTRKAQGKYQRLPDGTWGYPPEPRSYESSPEQAFERGWRAGWTAGYTAAMELVDRELERMREEPAR